jgi:adenylate kinase family enzyme
MKRVVIIGSGGSGKSTLARRLGEATGLPVIHLDSIFWRANWEKTPADEWERTVAELLDRDEWIMDGNFGGTRKMRISAADTVVFLDLPRVLCVIRAAKRFLRYRGKTRPDMAEGCREKMDIEFLSWIWNFPARSRPRIMEEMRAFPEKNFVILRSPREAREFLDRVSLQARR